MGALEDEGTKALRELRESMRMRRSSKADMATPTQPRDSVGAQQSTEQASASTPRQPEPQPSNNAEDIAGNHSAEAHSSLDAAAMLADQAVASDIEARSLADSNFFGAAPVVPAPAPCPTPKLSAAAKAQLASQLQWPYAKGCTSTPAAAAAAPTPTRSSTASKTTVTGDITRA